jgi:hypothetical protein
LGAALKKNIENDLQELLDYWASVEAYIKQAEPVNDAFITAAVNELRYAGRMLVHCLNDRYIKKDADEDKFIERYHAAKQYLMNAEHDVTDSIIIHYSRQIRELNVKYGSAYIEKTNTHYRIFSNRILSAKRLVSHSRRKLNKRVCIYKILRSKYVPIIISDYQMIENQSSEFKLESSLIREKLDVTEAKYKLSLYINYALLILFIIGAIGIYLR